MTIYLFASILLVVLYLIEATTSNNLLLEAKKEIHSLKFPNFLTQIDSFDYVKKETTSNSVVKNFRKLGRVNSDSRFRAIIEIKLQNKNKLFEILSTISDPKNKKAFGKFLTYDEIHKITDHKKSSAFVSNYLVNKGFRILNQTLNLEFLEVEGTVGLWEQLTSSKFFEFESKESPNFKVRRSLSYSLPIHLNNHISSILGITSFPSSYKPVKVLMKSIKQPLSSASYVTPSLLNSFYDIKNNTGSSLASQAVYESIGQSFSPSDLSIFQRAFNLPNQPVAVDINGHESDQACKANNGNDCVEANLDVQYLMAVAQSVPTTYYYWDGQDFLLEWIIEVSNMPKPPLVFSISYGIDEDVLPASYGDAFNTVALKLSLMGVTITASSGDDGSISSNARRNPMYCGYRPSFPASSPYVTAVGGTMGPESGKTEVACQSDKGGIITTGGGFSTLFPRPDWQNEVITNYFTLVEGTSNAPYSGYNKEGRGYPDISILAYNYVIVVNKNFTLVSGTSASSPVFAGMISLINSARLKAGKSSLGWINPSLYALKDSYTRDITDGSNNCVASATVCCSQGYHAVAGWDPVTGLGSVNFTKLEESLLDLGDIINYPTLAPTLAPNSPPTIPTEVPTLNPTQTPTAAPTYQSGWMHIEQYSTHACTGTINLVTAVPTERCLLEYDSSLEAVGSINYQCTRDYAIASIYSDTTCSSGSLIRQQYYYFGCAMAENYYYAPDYYSISLKCSSSGNSVPPLPLYDGSYVVHNSYNSPGCTSNQISYVEALLGNYCYNVDQKGFSYKAIYPKIYVYKKLNCKSLDSTIDLSSQCSEIQSSSYYYGGQRRLEDINPSYYYEQTSENVYENWIQGHFSASNPPSVHPTKVPSKAPFGIILSQPSIIPTTSPTIIQSSSPSINPSISSTIIPTSFPSSQSTNNIQSNFPSILPSIKPTILPSSFPSSSPSSKPSLSPISLPTSHPSNHPTIRPSNRFQPPLSPSSIPSKFPTTFNFPPIVIPSISPTFDLHPTLQPTVFPSEFPSITEKPFPPKPPQPSPYTNNPSIVSTRPPSRKFTPFPTSVSSIELTLQFSQIITGLSESQWFEEYNLCYLVFTSAVLKCLTGFSIQDFEIIQIIDIQADSRRLQDFPSFVSVNVSYDITITAENDNALSIVYNSASQMLSSSVKSGSFNNFLKSEAISYQNPYMQNSTCTAFQPISYYQLNPIITETTSTKNNPKILTIIWSFISVGLLLIALFVVLRNFPQIMKSSVLFGYSQVDLESDSVHNSAPEMQFNVMRSLGNPKNHLKLETDDPDEEIAIELAPRNFAVLSSHLEDSEI